MNRCLTGAALLSLIAWTPGLVLAADKDDKDFLEKAIVAGTKEIKLSELADTRSENAEVKKYAREVVEDHKRMHEELAREAKAVKLAVVAGAEPETKEAV